MRAASSRRRRAWLTWRTSPAEADLADHDHAGADRLVGGGAGHGHRHAEVDARLDEPHAADRGRVDVLGADAQPGPALEHGEQQRQAAAVEALGVAPGRRAGRDRDGQRLDLDEQRALALHRRHDDRSGDARPPIGEEQLRRIGHAREPGARHLEQAELVGRAEAVLHRPQQAQGVVALALERQHGVDDVLEQAGTGERAVLGDVADEHDRHAAPLGVDDQGLGALAHLDDRPGARRELRVGDGLDAVDDDQRRRRAVDGVDHAGRASSRWPATGRGARRRGARRAGGPAGPTPRRSRTAWCPATTPAAAAAACSCRCPARRRAG